MKEKQDLSADVRRLLEALVQVDPYSCSFEGLVEIFELRGMPYILRCIAIHLEKAAEGDYRLSDTAAPFGEVLEG